MFNYVLKNMWSHKARAVATALAVILGVAFLAGTLIFGDTIQRSFDDLFSSVTEGTDAAVRTKTEVDAGTDVTVEVRASRFLRLRPAFWRRFLRLTVVAAVFEAMTTIPCLRRDVF